MQVGMTDSLEITSHEWEERIRERERKKVTCFSISVVDI
jgi:hypothetical protein